MASAIPFPAPDGYHWQPQVAPEWRRVSAKRCRHQGAGHRACTDEAVMELNRGRRIGGPMRESWWAYCLDHAYGHWLEDGKVWTWVLIADLPDGAAETGYVVDSSDHHERVSPELAAMDAAYAAVDEPIRPAVMKRIIDAVWPGIAAAERAELIARIRQLPTTLTILGDDKDLAEVVRVDDLAALLADNPKDGK
jgi:hypothetical protein